MAYQNVGTPRFYVDYLLWLKSHGILESTSMQVSYHTGSPLEMVSLNPSNQYKLFEKDESVTYSYTDYPQAPQILDSNNAINNYVAVLGHNAASANASIHFASTETLDGVGGGILVNFTNGNPAYDGFTIAVNIDFGDGGIRIHSLRDVATADHYIGCYSHGNYWDCTHSPDINLTMTREYGGAKEFTTHNGSSMSNTMWHSAPKWGDLGAWELSSNGTTNHTLAKSGRRTWDLKFSYMDDGDLWGSNQMLTTRIGYTLSQSQMDLYDDDDLHDNSNFKYSIQEDDNFFSRVWHKTLGGTLPFIFQPDSSNNNPDQFAICKFKDNSLKATQSAFNVYDISLSIEEVW